MKKVSESIWIDSMPLRVGPAELGARMVVIKLNDGSLVLHSPIELNPSRKQHVDKLGNVSAIISPVKTHNLFVGDWLSAYPDASYYKVNEMPVERGGEKEYFLDNQEKYPWENDISYVNIGGIPFFNESVFLHKPSKTLIVSDLVFNLHHDQSMLGGMFLKLNGCYKKFTPSRIFKLQVKNKKDFTESVDKLLQLEFDNVIMAHGTPVFGGGHALMKSSLS